MVKSYAISRLHASARDFPVTPYEFVNKWRAVQLKESAFAKEHFLDLCALVEHPTPAQDDPAGQRFAFEMGVEKTGGGQGFADVAKLGYFGWEYKGKHAGLDAAYRQLLLYREKLDNPPLLVVCDGERIEVHSNFTNTPPRTVTITLDDLLTPAGMDHLRAIFYTPERFRGEQTVAQVTEQAAREFARLAEHLRATEPDPTRIAHFLIRLLFVLFAEDIQLLTAGLFTRLVDAGRSYPERFTLQLRLLFQAMATGGLFGEHPIRHFNGGLFDSDDVLPLDHAGLVILHHITALDWGGIEPSILGTLFERSLDPSKRAQLGAHYTSRDDILLIVDPVLMAPLRRTWQAARQEAEAELQRRDAQIEAWQQRSDRTADAKREQIRRLNTQSNAAVTALLDGALAEVRAVRVLDPACGSGNFLYVALRRLLDLEKEIITFAAATGVGGMLPQVDPRQLYGIEINDYAHELAQATVWIGYIQWLHENGFGVPQEPILQPLDNIRHMDAILAYDADGAPVEPEWPAADVIIGNPPFLGVQRLKRELGEWYADSLFALYEGQVPHGADIVCYWFERARYQIQSGFTQRAGLLATQSIRMGRSRIILERIKETGEIFMAWSDRPWVLDGAAVRVSMVGFDGGTETERILNGEAVSTILANLASGANTTTAVQLAENSGIGFKGIQKNGPFEITYKQARKILETTGNPNGRPNSDVVRPWWNATDVTKRNRNIWIIDFGSDMSIEEACEYHAPFEYVRQTVKICRQELDEQGKLRLANYPQLVEKWWIFERPRPEMRKALSPFFRYIVTPRVAKHRVFIWLDASVVPDGRLNVFARDDDYFFGILHSRIHEVWSLATSSRHGVGNDPTYNNTTCFETFPFPYPPGQEPVDDPRVQAIAAAAKELNEKREAWLNPPDLAPADLKKRTLTNLYNDRPTWLDLAHKRLDAAVFAAYAWPAALDDEQILARLLALNLARTR